ncbi:hypothetical protein G3N95_09835 [Paraburkholderia sp. Tr-20389]|uniref:hypothetical protein n=1 Tax=Paraburkholderia sp. Tr-20389 TaxID=2703903 RepID=UPI00197D59C2|nr:hypothetical protein [Paraburkholderia sp. Tr-20389]MBN3753245.1 hypothetical protein [Paraburkholderia sp. Tr-20389]
MNLKVLMLPLAVAGGVPLGGCYYPGPYAYSPAAVPLAPTAHAEGDVPVQSQPVVVSAVQPAPVYVAPVWPVWVQSVSIGFDLWGGHHWHR